MDSLENWHEEKQSSWLYRIVAEAEPDPRKKVMFNELANAADGQALIWAQRVHEAGDSLLPFQPTQRARLVARMIYFFGPQAIRPILAAMKVRGISVYSTVPLEMGHPMPISIADVGGRHASVSDGGNLRAAVFGVNDGLISNTSLIMGVAGASGEPKIVLLAGVAGLLAGAFSMAAGEYISVRSQRELYEYQIALERDELEEYPEEEAEELALIYNARGIPLEQARQMGRDILKDPEHALDTLSREELGINPSDIGSPWGAALSSFSAFSIGGLVPLLPFLLSMGEHSVLVAAILAACALFVVGALLSLFTGRKAWQSGLRMLLIGGAAGGITYLVGSLLGLSLM